MNPNTFKEFSTSSSTLGVVSATNTFRAVSTVMTLGSILVVCLRFPDGSYHFHTKWLEEDLEIYVNDSTGKKYIQPLLDANPFSVNVLALDGCSLKNYVKTYSLDLVSQIICIYAELGNQKCMAIAMACVAEALERRADNSQTQPPQPSN